MIEAVARQCDSLTSPQLDCADVWEWYGLALQTDQSPETIRKADPWYEKALNLNIRGGATGRQLALSQELEGQAQEILGDPDRAKELRALAAATRTADIAALGDQKPATDPVFKIGAGVQAPRVKTKIDPQYSEAARLIKQNGAVVLSVIIGPDGKPRHVQLLRSLGFGLDESAANSVLQWTFEPGAKNNEPVNVTATIEVNFRLF
jgi:TonB family protein